MSEQYFIKAYLIEGRQSMQLVPAPPSRDWMIETRQSFANRCLPMIIANQSGWFILSNHTFRALWTGGMGADSVEITYLEGEEPFPVFTSTGNGILTWLIPYLFTTPPGFNLQVRGPANHLKDAITALEGIVETDWSPATFTMNWKFTRPGVPVIFEKGEPICMIVPQKRAELELFEPEIIGLSQDVALMEHYVQWRDRRAEKGLEGHAYQAITAPNNSMWEMSYMRGDYGNGKKISDHQTSRTLNKFEWNFLGNTADDSE